MAITVEEKFESRRIETGDNPRVELRYAILGTDDDIAARAALADESPTSYDPWGTGGWFWLPRRTIKIEPAGDQWWEGVVTYGMSASLATSTFAFDIRGGTHHITQSRQTVGSYARPEQTAPDFKGAIGVTPESIEGTNIVVPGYTFSETHRFLNASVTPAYKRSLFELTGTVNNSGFRELQLGEALFLGAAGQRRGTGDWEIMFRFAASLNAENLTIGEITGINKKGWEYLWVRYVDEVDTVAKALVKRPIAAYVERLYEYGNYNLLEI